MKAFKFLLSLILLLNIDLYAQENVQKIREKLIDQTRKDVMVVSHRGVWREAPENSLPAIAKAIELGVDIVEIDVAKTKDGHLVLMHDKTLERTTTGKGKVSDWTLDSLKTLKLKNGAGIRSKHNIPTLEEALLLSKGKIMVNIDKAYNLFDEVYVLLEKTGTTNQIIMKGNATASKVKEQFGKYLDKVIYMPIVNLDKNTAEQDVIDFLTQLNPVAIEFVYTSDANPLPKKMVSLLKGKSKIWYNTLWDTMIGGHDDDLSVEDPNKGYGYLVKDLNARIIQTDRAQFLIQYLKSLNLH
jgi:glycerophosphoryl diester phosphodiesterase